MINFKTRRKKAPSKKYICYKQGKSCYSTGEPLSIPHISRISDKHFFGPLLETKQERIKREKKEKRNLLQNDSDGSSPKTLVERILDSKQKKIKNVKFDVEEYDRIASIYSEGHNSSKQMKKRSEFSNKPKKALPSQNALHGTVSHTNNHSNIELPSSTVSSTTSETAEHLPLTAQLRITQGISSNFKSLQPASSKSPNLIEVNYSKYEQVPQYLDLDYLQTFPLFRININTHQSPFSIHSPLSSLKINSFESTDHKVSSGNDSNVERAAEHDTSADQTTDGNITSINYNSGGRKSLPSVSRILSETMPEASRIALAKWEAKMIAELGEQGFQDYKKELFSQGSLLHECIHNHLQDSKPPSASALARIKGFWQSVEPVVAEVQEGQAVMALESRVIHPQLHYAGILDCVAIYRDTPVIVEWKTSTKPKRSLNATYDNPLQIAAYLGAMQHDPAYRHMQVQSGLLAFAYSDGRNSDTYVLSKAKLERYWRMWLGRLATFWKMNSVGTAVRHESVRNG